MFALTMKKVTLGTLIFFIFVSQHIFGKVIVLRGSPKGKHAEMICITEDDGSALVWNAIECDGQTYSEINNEVIEMELDYDSNNKSNVNNHDNLNCKMNKNKGCLESWIKDNWDLTNSLKTPMGPVFDQRWEEFREYKNIEEILARVDFNLTTEVKLSFSVRASHDVHLLICDGHYSKKLCYWILIGGWNNTQSVIRKCKRGMPLPKKWSEGDKECKQVTLYKHAPLSESEWRTFVITWDSVKQKINVYDTGGNNLTYTDEEKFLHSSKYHMYLGSDSKMLFRFHLYDFLYTTVDNAVLTSPTFYLNVDTDCVQLLIGLCAECDARVMLFDTSDNEVLKEITARGSSKVAIHGLPMWQSINIDTNSIKYGTYFVKIQLITKLNDKSSLNPLWAIASARYFQCSRNEILKKNNIMYSQCEKGQDYFWPNTTCQKLFYDEHAIVSPISPVKLDVNLDEVKCQRGKIGPQCLFSCSDDLESRKSCQGVKICHVDGYTCASYFSGDSCSELCKFNTYGPNCKKCGLCLNRTTKERCNKVTGVCSNGCNNTKEMVYVPPLCRTSIEKPDEPKIISTNETTIYAVVPITWKDEYKEISILYSFAIKKNGTYNDEQISWNKLFQNMTQLIRYFENLEPATNYQIRCSLLIADVQIHSDWKVAVTKSLDEPENYTFTINNNSVVDLNWFYPWKADYRLKCFRIRIEEIFSHLRENISRPPINKILEHPVTQYMNYYSHQLYLFPSTVYNVSVEAVTITNKSSNPKFMKIHTPSTATFDGLPEAMVESDSTILLNVPHVLNDTRDSMMHIIVKGANPCEQYSDVPESLRALAGVKMNETAWQAANVSTSEFSGQQFRIGDNTFYGNAINCPLKSGEFYNIWIIVMGNNSFTNPIMLTSSIRIDVPMHYVPWLILIILLLVLTGAAFYLCRRRKRQREIERIRQFESALPRDMNIHDVEMNHIISSLDTYLEDCPNVSNGHFSSETIESETSNAITHDDEEEEMQSLVEVHNFEDYVRQAIQSGLLNKQYKTFPKGPIRTWNYGKLPDNKYKNRYEDLIAYDDTRVILRNLPGDIHSDYINANYITVCGTERSYIATQGPKSNTIVDFWRMVWQDNVYIICMLANVVENGKTICEQYWPDIGKKKKYGDILVLNAKHNIFADYCFRTFHVTCGDETRKIEHLHYTAWPDHGVPSYTHSIVTYLKKLLATSSRGGPIVVHCSAGTGRTGTIILCDICLHRAATEESISVFAEMTSIATKRPNLMDNEQQYLLGHLVLLECFFSILTTLPCNHMLVTQIRKQMSIQHQRLQNVAWQDEVLRHGTSPLPLSERNRAKNRFPELILDNVNRIYLKRYPASDEESDYISGVYVDGVKLQNQYLATQLPMPSTNNDFWRMVAEFKVGLILMLQPPDFQDPTCCAIAPASGKFKPIPYLNITLEDVVEMEYYTLQKLLLVDNSEKPSRKQSVTILCLTEWKPGKNQPPPPVMMMITFWQAVERIARGNGLTVTLCHDGVTGCGLYLAMSFLLERMANEGECDVYLAVRAIRRSRPDFVRLLEHLEYLCEAAVTYLECVKPYANNS